MRPYLVWLVSAAAALAVSIPTAGVSAAFVAGRGPSMAFHSRPPSFQRPAPRPQMAPLAGWGRNEGRWWRWRSRAFAGAWSFAGVWPYVSSSYGYDPYAYGYGFDPYAYGYGYDSSAYGYGYPFTFGWYDPSHGYGFDPYTHGNGYGPYAYGYGASYGDAVHIYRVAPSAKIIHLTPRE
jgi:hypothetical protein